MTSKPDNTHRGLTARDRERLLKEAADRARARSERPARQAANETRLASQGRRASMSRSVDLAGRIQATQADLEARHRVWAAEHDAQRAERCKHGRSRGECSEGCKFTADTLRSDTPTVFRGGAEVRKSG